MKIEQVQIGLDTAKKYLHYHDTGIRLEDLDIAFKVSVPTAIDFEDVYFEDEDKAKAFIKTFEE